MRSSSGRCSVSKESRFHKLERPFFDNEGTWLFAKSINQMLWLVEAMVFSAEDRQSQRPFSPLSSLGEPPVTCRQRSESSSLGLIEPIMNEDLKPGKS